MARGSKDGPGAAREPDRLANAPPKILLVEDELAAAEAIGYLLRMNGFQVVSASDGREALELLAEVCPDLVLTDIMMPWMDGLELARHIRERPELRDLPIVLMSAAHGILPPETIVSASLPKPLDFPRLLATLGRLLDLKSG
jgi:two-component system, OmpR family, response regulator VicR